MTDQCVDVLVVGGSVAGLQTIEELRHAGFAGSIAVIEPEEGLPYDRPPLSKQVLVGKWEPERAILRDAATFDALDLSVIRGSAVGLSLEDHTVTVDDGSRWTYDKLVIATGASPIAPAGMPLGNKFSTLRTLDDARRLRANLTKARSIVVIGGGMIGSEIASSAASLGKRVTIIDADTLPLVKQLGETAASWIRDAHTTAGVGLRLGESVASVSSDERGVVVRLVSGESVEADLGVLAIGVRPVVNWLAGSGLELDNGIVCDEGCLAVEDVFAAGDVANVLNTRFGLRMRVEHRTVTTDHARVVARRILGEPTSYDAIPFFWSDQHGVRLQGYGVNSPGLIDHQVRMDDEALGAGRIVHSFQEGRLVGVLAYGVRPADFAPMMKLVQAATMVSATPAR
jgi:3-phenylpropionate/trans-cinnamate dioxygenase ferredoxin reductase component